MRKALLVALILTAAGAAAWYFLRPKSDREAQSLPSPIVFPIATSTDESREQAAARDILDDPDVKEDPVNPGYYYIGHQPQGSDTPYLIAFVQETNYFNISLLEEPIGQARIDAETYLMGKIQRPKEKMCELNYTVAVPNSVNSAFSGMNLGFSFCPGAVKLP